MAKTPITLPKTPSIPAPKPQGKTVSNRLSPEAKAIIVNSRDDLVKLYEFCSNASKSLVVERLANPEISVMEDCILRAILSDMQCGRTSTIEKLMERVYGKTTQVIAASVGVKTLEQLVEGANSDDI